jgi:hypothetical protein
VSFFAVCSVPPKTNKNGPPSRTSEKKPEQSQDYLKIQTYEHLSEPHTIKKTHLKPRKHITDTFNESGIYQLKCNNCPLNCVGQTGGNFRTRSKENIQAIG